MRIVAVVVFVSLTVACVERRLHIRTEPEGATVHVNGDELGPSPVSWRFHHYGTVRVTVEIEGYEPEQKEVRLRAPWYQYPVVDLFADVIVPTRINDDHHVTIELKARESTPKAEDQTRAEELAQRAVALREDLRANIEKSKAQEESPE